MNRKYTYSMYFTKDEKEWLDEEAKRTSIPKSTIIRLMVQEKMKKDKK